MRRKRIQAIWRRKPRRKVRWRKKRRQRKSVLRENSTKASTAKPVTSSPKPPSVSNRRPNTSSNVSGNVIFVVLHSYIPLCLWSRTEKKNRKNTCLIIPCPKSQGVSEHVSKQGEAIKRVSGASEWKNGKVSGPVLQSVFLVVLDYSAIWSLSFFIPTSVRP